MRTKLAPLLLLTSTLVAGACADTGFDPGKQDGSGRGDGPVVQSDFGPLPDGFDPGCDEVIDLVFVLDVSSSMGLILDTLEREIDRVVNASNALADDSRFGLVTFVDNFLIDTTGPLEAGMVHTAASTLQSAFATNRSIYTEYNINPGDGPNGPTMQNPICEENALDALYAAAEQFPWRERSTRVIIVVTDDTFLERDDNYGDRDGDGLTDKLDFPREGDYPALRTVAETEALLRDKKVRVFSFSNALPPNCGTGRRLPVQFVGAGWNMEYKGHPTIPDATGGRDFDVNKVFAGTLSLTETINNVVLESRCNPIE